MHARGTPQASTQGKGVPLKQSNRQAAASSANGVGHGEGYSANEPSSSIQRWRAGAPALEAFVKHTHLTHAHVQGARASTQNT